MIKVIRGRIYLLIIISLVFWKCSSEKTNVISRTYHNTTAHYNAYFYANEGIKEVKNGIAESHQNDFDNVLSVFPPLDSSYATTYKEQIEDVIKKASIAIQHHENSKWVDDSYILIGLARLYGHEHEHAIETFKYVNTESENDDARHRALIHLMRTFIEYGEMNNALSVSDYLKKEDLNKKNLKRLYLMRAYFYQKREDYNNMVNNLVEAAPLLKKKDGKAKIYFIIGQVYQKLGFDAEAYSNYKKCLAGNPPYELSFYSKLNMAQVAELNKSSDVRRIRKYFKKLVTDAKNIEFRDKIYYEMAKFEMKQKKLEDAISLYKKSVAASVNNRRQKGLSYLALGRIYYDTLRNYELAQAYYDSTIMVIPKDYEEYEAVKTRQEVLDDFIKQLKTIELQDSLLLLSEIDSIGLVKMFNDQIEARQKREKEQEEANKRNRRSNGGQLSFNTDNTGISSSSLNWYFSNPSAISLGQIEFRKIWGNRPLEDHWRRSNKDTSTPAEELVASSSFDETSSSTEQNNGELSNTSEIKSMLAFVPFSKEEKEKALNKIKDAYYNLGNIYHFKLKEEKNALEAFETLISRFPDSKYEPEVLYLLYLISKDLNTGNSEQYKNRLTENYPKTTYAKLINNPNYTEESSKELGQMKETYRKAYRFFDQEAYDEAREVVKYALENYSQNAFYARFKLLNIMITGKTDDIHKYKYQLDNFIEEYPDNEITPFAKELKEAANNYQAKIEKIWGAQYIKFFEQPHYFVYMLDSGKRIESYSKKIEQFNNEYFPELNLKTGSLIFNDDFSLILVNDLPDKQLSQKYYDYFHANIDFIQSNTSFNFNNFVITKDNFDILYRSKDIEGYIEFFDENY